MTRRFLFLLVLLTLGACGSAIGIVYAKYLVRLEFVALQALEAERHGLEVQWGRLQLEEAALATHPRVEDRARNLLGMHLPGGGEVWVIDGGGHDQ